MISARIEEQHYSSSIEYAKLSGLLGYTSGIGKMVVT